MPFCITGMHRSGTSMVSRALNLCGLYLGEREQLRRFGDDNVEGYWEHDDFVDLNEQLLETLGGGWDLPFPETSGWEHSPSLDGLRGDGRSLVDWFASREPWGWKDPRNALVLPFWQSLIPGLRFVVCLRDPMEVALSLNKRGRSSIRFGLSLWEEHYRRILAHTTRDDRIVTRYAECLEHPMRECERLAAFVGLSPSEAAVESMNPQLRHQRSSGTHDSTSALPSSVAALYESLGREAVREPVAAPTRLRHESAVTELTATTHVDLTSAAMAFLVPLADTPGGGAYDATSNDPQLALRLPPFPSASVRAVRFRLRRATSEAAVAQLFWTHEPDAPFSERHSTTVFLEPAASGWCDYRFRLDRPPVRERWLAGPTIASLRLDPTNVPGRFELESLVLET